MASNDPAEILSQLRLLAMDRHSPEACRETIQAAIRCKGALDAAIQRVAQLHVPDFHFLNHAVARNWLWECPTSPIGLCVYPIDSQGRCNWDDCIYCHGPEERK